MMVCSVMNEGWLVIVCVLVMVFLMLMMFLLFLIFCMCQLYVWQWVVVFLYSVMLVLFLIEIWLWLQNMMRLFSCWIVVSDDVFEVIFFLMLLLEVMIQMQWLKGLVFGLVFGLNRLCLQCEVIVILIVDVSFCFSGLVVILMLGVWWNFGCLGVLDFQVCNDLMLDSFRLKLLRQSWMQRVRLLCLVDKMN